MNREEALVYPDLRRALDRVMKLMIKEGLVTMTKEKPIRPVAGEGIVDGMIDPIWRNPMIRRRRYKQRHRATPMRVGERVVAYYREAHRSFSAHLLHIQCGTPSAQVENGTLMIRCSAVNLRHLPLMRLRFGDPRGHSYFVLRAEKPATDALGITYQEATLCSVNLAEYTNICRVDGLRLFQDRRWIAYKGNVIKIGNSQADAILNVMNAIAQLTTDKLSE